MFSSLKIYRNEPKQTNDVERIVEAICLEKPMLRFLPSIHAVANDTESDTCDNGYSCEAT